MAKNKDRRKFSKPKEKPGPAPFTEKFRPDLMIRIQNKCVGIGYKGLQTGLLAKTLGESPHDVEVCLDRLVAMGSLSKSGNSFLPTVPKPAERPPEKPVEPDLVLKIRRIFSKCGYVRPEELEQFDGAQEVIADFCKKGIARLALNGCYEICEVRTVIGTRSSFRSSRHRTASSVCPWCGRPVRRHSRVEVHDATQCRLDMIASIMGE